MLRKYKHSALFQRCSSDSTLSETFEDVLHIFELYRRNIVISYIVLNYHLSQRKGFGKIFLVFSDPAASFRIFSAAFYSCKLWYFIIFFYGYFHPCQILCCAAVALYALDDLKRSPICLETIPLKRSPICLETIPLKIEIRFLVSLHPVYCLQYWIHPSHSALLSYEYFLFKDTE